MSSALSHYHPADIDLDAGHNRNIHRAHVWAMSSLTLTHKQSASFQRVSSATPAGQSPSRSTLPTRPPLAQLFNADKLIQPTLPRSSEQMAKGVSVNGIDSINAVYDDDKRRM